MPAAHISQSDFEEKVLKSSVPVLVDFWAEWCVDPRTEVAVGDRQAVVASLVKDGQPILSFKNGIYNDKVDYSKTITDGGHCKQVRTEGGRLIKVTDDHLFWTDKGWKAAQDLGKGTKVAVYPMIKPLGLRKDDRIVMNEDMLRGAAMLRMRIEQYVSDLHDKNLLTLRMDSEKLPILARLMGALFTDGTLYFQVSNNYREVGFILGDMRDVESVVGDLRSLGFNYHVSERVSRQVIQGRAFTSHTYRVKCLSTGLWLLFKALGVPVGNKTNQAYGLPEWLFDTPKLVKREFLAGFLGGDGPKLLMSESQRELKEPYNSLKINDLEFYKREDMVDSGVKLARELIMLLADFGVEAASVFTERAPYRRQDGSQTVIVHLQFRQGFETGYNLATQVGYAYCWSKEQTAKLVGEFLQRVMVLRSRWESLYRRVINSAKTTGSSPVMTAREFGISQSTAWAWLKIGRKPTTPRHYMKFKSWLGQVTEGLKDGLVWDVVSEVQETFLPQVQRITVAQQHSFVANGFVVHNCGPCKMAAPILDELADEYSGKVAILKLNTDENHDAAVQYGVMSIPTVILFKDGKEVERKIGFGGKQGYVDLIQKVTQ